MNHRTAASIAAIAAGVALASSAATASVNDKYISFQNLPSDPIVDPDGNIWGTDWSPIVTMPYQITIGGFSSVFLGLDNLYVEEWTKYVTIKYDTTTGGTLEVGLNHAGYPDSFPGITAWDSVSGPSTDPTHANGYIITGMINPQPSWEWIELRNISQIDVTITLTEFSSYCIPTPGSAAILALAGLAGWSHRRRR